MDYRDRFAGGAGPCIGEIMKTPEQWGELIAGAIREAVAEEREACAQLVEQVWGGFTVARLAAGVLGCRHHPHSSQESPSALVGDKQILSEVRDLYNKLHPKG